MSFNAHGFSNFYLWFVLWNERIGNGFIGDCAERNTCESCRAPLQIPRSVTEYCNISLTIAIIIGGDR